MGLCAKADNVCYRSFCHIRLVILLMESINIIFALVTILHKSLSMYFSFPIISTLNCFIWTNLMTNAPCNPTRVNSLVGCSTMAYVGHQQVSPLCTYVVSRNLKEWSGFWKLPLRGVSRSCYNYLPWIKHSNPILPYFGVFTTYPLILSLHQRWISYLRLVIGEELPTYLTSLYISSFLCVLGLAFGELFFPYVVVVSGNHLMHLRWLEVHIVRRKGKADNLEDLF